MNLIYALDENGKNELLARGFNFINEQVLNDKVLYLFENSPEKVLNFSVEDKKRFLITNKIYF